MSATTDREIQLGRRRVAEAEHELWRRRLALRRVLAGVEGSRSGEGVCVVSMTVDWAARQVVFEPPACDATVVVNGVRVTLPLDGPVMVPVGALEDRR